MTNQIDHIVKHFFRKNNLEEVSENELEQFVHSHPYFAAGHFLLAKKIQASRPEETRQKIATAALYYNNPLWLQWLLDQELNNRLNENISDSQQTAGIAEEGSNVHKDASFLHQSHDIDEQETEILAHNASESAHDSETIQEQFPDGKSYKDDITGVSVQSEMSAELGTDNKINDQYREYRQEENRSGEVSANADMFTSTADQFSNATADNIAEQDSPSRVHEFNDAPADRSINGADNSEEENNSEQSSDRRQIEAGSDSDTGITEDDSESKATAASIGRTLASAALIPTKAEIEKNDFTFEPYHTIDYFASQGIALQQADLSKDKFGKQLKSFTEWLRSMKRLPEASLDINMDEATQRTIQQVAEHSIEEKEIVTETMAEVWIKQGNTEKAIDTLHKLSLLNPSKSHYFAAKIEQLKGL
jgi:hypothetical protein